MFLCGLGEAVRQGGRAEPFIPWTDFIPGGMPALRGLSRDRRSDLPNVRDGWIADLPALASWAKLSEAPGTWGLGWAVRLASQLAKHEARDSLPTAGTCDVPAPNRVTSLPWRALMRR